MTSEELKKEIVRIKKEKNIVILGHYYQIDDIQEISDYVGDSLALAQEAQRTDAPIIVFCGVHFMAETAKILNPTRKVLLPDMAASCSLAESYLICTSGNAEKLINALPADQKIIFAPDKNLGSYINRQTGRNMLLWNGVCTVHDALEAEGILKLKQTYPDAPVVAHPECNAAVLAVSDFIGSTKAMLSYIQKTDYKRYIVATESGILYEMRRNNPDKEFVAVSAGESCACLDCSYMKMNTLEKLYRCVCDEQPEILLDAELIAKARKPIVRMLDMSKQLGIIK